MWPIVLLVIASLGTTILGVRAVVRPFPADARRQRLAHGVLLLACGLVGLVCSVLSATKQASTTGKVHELQERTRPRTISAEQRTRLIELLKDAPKGPVEVEHLVGDSEGFGFAAQIAEVLRVSGWSTDLNQRIPRRTPVGVEIWVHAARTAPPHAGVLQRAFGSVGIPFAGVEEADFAEGKVLILVGGKP
jgi:hypothetical protein